jgi:hypothetical protein
MCAERVVDEGNGSAIGVLHSSGLELADHDVAGLAIDEGEDAVGVSTPQDGIAFEVANAAAVLSAWRSLGDVPFSSQAAATVVVAVAFSALLGGVPKVEVEASPSLPVLPDVAVNGLMADGEKPPEPEPSGDLLWAPLLLEAGFDKGPLSQAELAIPSRT